MYAPHATLYSVRWMYVCTTYDSITVHVVNCICYVLPRFCCHVPSAAAHTTPDLQVYTRFTLFIHITVRMDLR